MNCPSPPARYNPTNEPLWLIVQRDDRTHCFEFPADSHQAIVVGSANDADVRIRGAAPIAFFLERDGQAISLTPAYADDKLRVDTRKVEGKRQIYGCALVEFANVELRLDVWDYPPTLRGDGQARNSEISDPVSKRITPALLNDLTATTTIKSSTVLAALRQCETTTLSPHKALLGAALPTKTIEMDVFNFEPWFDEPAELPPNASIDTQPHDPIQMSLTPKSNIETRPAAEPLRPLRQQVCPANFKTQKIAPIQWLPELAAVAEDEQATAVVSSVVTSEAQRNDTAAASAPIDPYRTIEMSPMHLPDPGSPRRAACPKLESLRQTVTIQISDVGHGCDTTDFEVPVVRRPKRLSPSAALARLGLLTKRHPVFVVCGAAVGALVLGMCFARATRLMGPHSIQKQERVTAARAVLAGTSTATLPEPKKASPNDSASENSILTSAAAPRASTGIRQQDVPAAIAAVPDVSAAVGHIFAGRLPEAEQAYRELSVKFPNEPAFQSASRILNRKNSPKCRGANPTKTACPSVKP